VHCSNITNYNGNLSNDYTESMERQLTRGQDNLSRDFSLPTVAFPPGPLCSLSTSPKHLLLKRLLLHTSQPDFEDGTDKVFRNVGIQ